MIQAHSQHDNGYQSPPTIGLRTVALLSRPVGCVFFCQYRSYCSWFKPMGVTFQRVAIRIRAPKGVPPTSKYGQQLEIISATQITTCYHGQLSGLGILSVSWVT